MIDIERQARLEKEKKSLDIIHDRFVIGDYFSAKKYPRYYLYVGVFIMIAFDSF